MKKIKFAILFFIVLIIFILVILFIVKNRSNNVSQTNQYTELKEEIVQKHLNIVDNQSMYFTVEACIDTFVEYAAKKDKASVYKLLDDSYIKEYNIKEDTVMNNIGYIPNSADFDTQKMLLSKGNGENLQQYYVYGVLRNKEGDKINKQKMYLTVNIDLDNMIYSIIPNFPDEEVFYE